MQSTLPKFAVANRVQRDTPILSVIVPAYNEHDHLEQILSRVLAIPLSFEVIVIDDGSTDGTFSLLGRLNNLPNLHIVQHEKNRGKGAALRTGFALARGDIIIVQDADLEYDPSDYEKIIQPILDGRAEVVYGSRFSGSRKRPMPLLPYFANRLITRLFNRVYAQRFTDVETCYKAIQKTVLDRIRSRLTEERFGIEIELTARLAQIPGLRFDEVPIRYHARHRNDGKKIRFRDGLRALLCIMKYRRASDATP